MKPELLSAALQQWRAAYLTGVMPAAVVVEDHVLSLETCLLLAAENLDRQTRERDALLWVLWHHQGGSSPVGQPIRRALGIGRFEHLTAEQVLRAKAFAKSQGVDQTDLA